MTRKVLVTLDLTNHTVKAVNKDDVPLSLLLACPFFTFYDDGTYLSHRETRVRTWKIEDGWLYFKLRRDWQRFNSNNLKGMNDQIVKLLKDAMVESVLLG